MPVVEAARPVQAGLCRSVSKSICRKSSTGSKMPKRAKECRSDAKPKFAQSGTGKKGSNLLRLRTDRFSWRNPLGNLISPDADERDPVRVKPRIGRVSSMCKKSSTDGRGAILAALLARVTDSA